MWRAMHEGQVVWACDMQLSDLDSNAAHSTLLLLAYIGVHKTALTGVQRCDGTQNRLQSWGGSTVIT